MLAIDPGAWDAATWSAAGTWATAAVYLLILVYAARQVGEARSLRGEQARPFVVVDFDVDWLTQLRIENAGRTIAHDVKVSFDPALTSTLTKPWPWEDSPLFDEGIPTLAPGKTIRVPFDSYLARSEKKLDMAYKVTVTYTGYKKKSYTDEYTLDLGIYEGTSPPDKGMPDLIKAVDETRKEIHKWTDGINGLRVHVLDKEKRDRRAHRPMWIEQAEKVRKEKGWIAYLRYLVERALERRGWIS